MKLCSWCGDALRSCTCFPGEMRRAPVRLHSIKVRAQQGARTLRLRQAFKLHVATISKEPPR